MWSPTGTEYSSLLVVVGYMRPSRLSLTMRYPALGVVHLVDNSSAADPFEQCDAAGALCVPAIGKGVGDYVTISSLLRSLTAAHAECQARQHPHGSVPTAGWPTWLQRLVHRQQAGGCGALFSRLSGVMYVHMDFWVSPRLTRRLRPNVPWRLHQGLVGTHLRIWPLTLRILRPTDVYANPRLRGKKLGTLPAGARVNVSLSDAGFRFRYLARTPQITYNASQASFRLLAPSAPAGPHDGGLGGGGRPGGGGVGDGILQPLAGWISAPLVPRPLPTPPFEPEGFYHGGTRHAGPAQPQPGTARAGGDGGAAGAAAPSAQHCLSGAVLPTDQVWLTDQMSMKALSAAAGVDAVVAAERLDNSEHGHGVGGRGGGGAGGRHRFADVVCAGWVDMWHIPLRLAAPFAALAELYASHGVWFEVAVATILHILSRGSDPQHEEVVHECFGCCCCSMGSGLDPAQVLRDYACGHRIDLTDERARAALMATMLDGDAGTGRASLME